MSELPDAVRDVGDEAGDGAGLGVRRQDLVGQVDVGRRVLHADLLQPGGAGQDDVGVAAGRLGVEQVVADDGADPVQAGRQPVRVGEARQAVGAEQQQDVDPAVLHRPRHRGHVARDVVAGRALPGGGDVGRAFAVGAATMARPEPAAGDAVLAGQGRQAGDGAARLPAALMLEHRGAAEDDRGRLLGGVQSSEPADGLGVEAGDLGGPVRGVLPERRRRAARTRRCAPRRTPGPPGPSATMTCIIPSASAASVPGRMTSIRSAWRAVSVRRTSMATMVAPRSFAATRCGAVVGWLATLAPHMMMVWELLAEVFLGVAVGGAGQLEPVAAQRPADDATSSRTGSR